MSRSSNQSSWGIMPHRRSGSHGLRLSAVSLSMGGCVAAPSAPVPLRDLLRHAMDAGVSHFDITPDTRNPEGSAAAIAVALSSVLPYRDTLVFSARVGLNSWQGGMTGFGSRKSLLSGLDSLLLHTGLDYIDLLYAHRYDTGTPLEETVAALASAVQQGKALYAGLSSYAPSMVRAALPHFAELGVPLVSYQASYSLLDRWIEEGVVDILQRHGVGCVAAAPLAHGALSDPVWSEPRQDIPPLPALSRIATERGQTLAQLALSWVLRDPVITSALVTAARPRHIAEARAAAEQSIFTPADLAAVETCCPPPERACPPGHPHRKEPKFSPGQRTDSRLSPLDG